MAFNGVHNPMLGFELPPQSVINQQITDEMAVKVVEGIISEKCGAVLNEATNMVAAVTLKVSKEMTSLKESLQSFGQEISSAVSLLINHTNNAFEKVATEINLMKEEKESGESLHGMLTEVSSSQENMSSYMTLLRQELQQSQKDILEKIAAEIRRLEIEPVPSTSKLTKTFPTDGTSKQRGKSNIKGMDSLSISDEDPDNDIFDANVDGFDDARISDVETEVFGASLAPKKKK